MTYREFINSALPPAPEYPALRRLRVITAALCLTSAILLGLSRANGNALPWLSVVSVFISIFSLGLLVHLFRRKMRHDLDYWTMDRVEQRRLSHRPAHRIDPVVDVRTDRR